jgi:hypothetical protein
LQLLDVLFRLERRELRSSLFGKDDGVLGSIFLALRSSLLLLG